MGIDRLSARKAVFLDRDGVLNRAVVRDGKPFPPASPSELRLHAGVREACDALRAANFLLIVVTNQPDVARGTRLRTTVESINAVLRRSLPLDDVRVCYHDDCDGCTCRKPQPGLLREAAADWGIDLQQSFMVGDRARDIEAGRRAGCRCFLVRHDYREPLPSIGFRAVQSLSEAATLIMIADGSRPARQP